MISNKIYLLLLLSCLSLSSYSESLLITEEDKTFLPQVLIQLDSKFSHHVAVVEKSTHTLYLYENNDGRPSLVKKYRIATGKKAGNKKDQGDYKTPEGIYQIQAFLSKNNLVDKYGDYANIYGAGAFTMNYPNVIDARAGKTGGGIWLHSTDDDTRIDKGLDSRGCVVVVDQDLMDISRFIDLEHTSIVIVQNMHFVKKDTWLKNRQKILGVVNGWAEAWKAEDLNKYIGYYSKDFTDYRRGNYYGFRNYKRAVFNNPGKPLIEFSHVSVLMHDSYAVVQMQQKYQSSTIQDTDKKTLYLVRDDEYNWKIISEIWNKLPDSQNLAFTPSMRFFKGEKAVVKQ